MKDALGNDLIHGNCYGYARTDNGFNIVIIGTLEKITEKRAILKNIKYLKSVYNTQPEPDPTVDMPIRSAVKPFLCFPVDEKNI